MEQDNMDDSSYLDFDGPFLTNLPPSIRRYTYHGEQQFSNIFESESSTNSELILFHASKETIEALFNPDQETPIAKLCSSFDTKERLFLITMPSKPHSATIRGDDRGKQPDHGWGPRRRARGEPDSPSVVLEVAYSESNSKSNSDVRFWLNPNEGNANICLTLQIHKSRPEIRIEKWERRQGRIYRSEVTYITKKGDHSNVTHHPINIPFESLLRRPSERGERDIEFSRGQLVEIAETIWETQGW
ncbi:hypothetical protein N7463_006461 [Penicillium fimorum]|uniref:Uncharacterized protein n=1 Tax=Penicillium fimorum TaxID=1882269 RepID=A0A9X0C667_9EURO|nr:hypothetical protein N7463_006461 [Penicillium fimorum]